MRKIFCNRISRWFDGGGVAVFCLVGAVGFCTDGGLLTLLSQRYNFNVYESRLFSFVAATFVTWLLNRVFVFKTTSSDLSEKRQEYLRYFFIQIGGAFLNLGVFSILIKSFPVLHSILVVPLAIGAIFGLAFNYSGAKYWVFKEIIK